MTKNPIQMIKTYMGMNSPEQIIYQMMGKSNPMVNNLIQMAKSGDSKQLENFARNYCKERGVNFDKEFSSFMSNFKQ